MWSTIAFLGFVVLVVGLVALVRPIPRVWLPTRRRAGLATLCGFALFVVGAVIDTVPSSSEPEQDATEAVEPIPAPVPLEEITADALLQAYEANQLAADRDYRDQIMLVNGTVESIADDFLGTPYVTLTTGSGLWSVHAMFERDQDEGRLADLTKGQPLTVQCRVDGKFGNVILRECSIFP